MILFWFILGIALIFGIARYNESNKLFWTLAFAFVMGFAGTKMVLQTIDGNEQSNSCNVTCVYSTQLPSTVSMVAILDELFEEPVDVTDPNAVSRIYTQETLTNVTLSKVIGRIRDQPLLTLIKPPELCLQKDFLTLHDTG